MPPAASLQLCMLIAVWFAVGLAPIQGALLRAARVLASPPENVVKLSESLMKERDALSNLTLFCAEGDRVDAITVEDALVRMHEADAVVGLLATRELKAQAVKEEQAMKMEKLKARKLRIGKLCSRSKESRALQRKMLNESSDLADKVDEVLKSLPGSANARLARVQGAVTDHMARLDKGRGWNREACAEQLAAFDDEMANMRYFEMEAESRFQTIIFQKSSALDRQKVASQELANLQAAADLRAENCRNQTKSSTTHIKEMEEERAKLAMSAGRQEPIIDCEVTPWRPNGSCSVSCGGGGSRLVSRLIVRTADAWGAKCPTLMKSLDCGGASCPVDCEMGQWNDWSGCSAKCDGGQRTRARQVVKPSLYGGTPCAPAKSMQACNVRPCDVGCSFGDWGPWGPCSKACGLGQRVRRRNTNNPSLGCREDRFGFETCKEQTCASPFNCTTFMDLVLLVDGSELMSTKEFKKQLEFAEALLGQLQIEPQRGPQAAAMLLGTSSEVQLLAPLGSSSQQLAAAVAGTTRGKGGLRLEDGLIAASRHLDKNGRPGALRAVLVLLEGEPDSIFLAADQAHNMQENGIRVTFAVTGCLVDDRSFERLASPPLEENLFRADSFADLIGEIQQHLVEFCTSPDLTRNVTDYVPGAPNAPALPAPKEPRLWIPAPAPDPAPSPLPAASPASSPHEGNANASHWNSSNISANTSSAGRAGE